MADQGAQLGGMTPRTRVRREPHKAVYDQSAIFSIVDATCFCSVGVVVDGAPVVLPSIHARDGETLLLHGSVSALLVRTMASGAPLCVSVTLTDGIIVARSAFNSSIAYRSAVLFGTATLLEDPDEIEAALDRLTEAVIPGRTSEVRRPTESELRRTAVVRFSISEASAKISAGPPDDEPEDLNGGAWAGVVPIETSFGAPVPAPDLAASLSEGGPPASVRSLFGRA